MAISFPLPLSSLVDMFPDGDFEFDIIRGDSVSGLASGEPIVVNRRPPLWGGTFTTLSLFPDEAQRFLAALHVLDGPTNPFYLYDLRYCAPAADPGGVTYGASTPLLGTIGADNKSMSVTGLPVGYVLSAGDRFDLTYDTSRRFYGEVSETVTADGAGGIASIEVRPHFRPGIVGNTALNFIKAAAKVKLTTAPVQAKKFIGKRRVISFAFQQTLSKD